MGVGFASVNFLFRQNWLCKDHERLEAEPDRLKDKMVTNRKDYEKIVSNSTMD